MMKLITTILILTLIPSNGFCLRPISSSKGKSGAKLIKEVSGKKQIPDEAKSSPEVELPIYQKNTKQAEIVPITIGVFNYNESQLRRLHNRIMAQVGSQRGLGDQPDGSSLWEIENERYLKIVNIGEVDISQPEAVKALVGKASIWDACVTSNQASAELLSHSLSNLCVFQHSHSIPSDYMDPFYLTLYKDGALIDESIGSEAILSFARENFMQRIKQIHKHTIDFLYASRSYAYALIRYEEQIAKESELSFYIKPYYAKGRGGSRLIFENTENIGKKPMFLREGDFVKITDSRTHRSWEAEVFSVEGNRVVVTVPRNMDLRRERPDSGTINKKPDISVLEVHIEFLNALITELDVVIQTGKAPGRGLRYTFSPLIWNILGVIEEFPYDNKGRLLYEVVLSNPDIANDKSQMQALANALDCWGRIELIQGPPGTGKTTLTTEIIYQNAQRGYSQLIACQTNKGLDKLLLECKEKGIDVIRLGNNPQKIDPKLRENWIDHNRPRRNAMPNKPKNWSKEKYKSHKQRIRREYVEWKESVDERLRNGAIVGATCIGIAKDQFFRDHKFDCVVLEEASVASFTEFMIPISRAKTRIIVVGDQNQLGLSPMPGEIRQILEEELEKSGIDLSVIPRIQKSFFEYLINQGRFNLTTLTNCYRMTQKLVGHSNAYYDGMLVPSRQGVSEELNDQSLVFIDTAGLPLVKRKEADRKKRRGNNDEDTSVRNQLERELVAVVLSIILNSGVAGFDEIGIISPYAAQANNIRADVKGLLDFRDYLEIEENIGTAWPFQGRELPLVITSLTRSNEPRGADKLTTTGFYSWNMLNVIESRAQDRLIIIGDSSTFLQSSNEEMRQKFVAAFDYVKQNGIYVLLGVSGQKIETEISNTLSRHIPVGKKYRQAQHSPSPKLSPAIRNAFAGAA